MKKFKLKQLTTLYTETTNASKCGKLENTFIQVPMGKVVYGKIVYKVDVASGSPTPRKFIQLGGMEDDLIGKYIYGFTVLEEANVPGNKYSNADAENGTVGNRKLFSTLSTTKKVILAVVVLGSIFAIYKLNKSA